MKTLRCLLAGCVLAVATLSSTEAAIRQEQINFRKGTAQAEIKGRIKGRETVDYLVRARAGQSLSVIFAPSNLSANFNVLPPGTDDAIFIGSSSGNRFDGRLAAEGVYTIRVYLMRSAARRNEMSKYTLKVAITDGKGTASSATDAVTSPLQPFDRSLELQGIRFHVDCDNKGSLNVLRLFPSGLEIDNSPIIRNIEGTVTGAEVSDLNADGSPEIYVYVTSAGSGSYGSLVAFSVNRRKSLSEIYLAPITENKAASQGYRGHDEFAVLEGVLGQRFPVYRDTDTNAAPTGGMRQIQYKLVPGEAGWILAIDRTIEF